MNVELTEDQAGTIVAALRLYAIELDKNAAGCRGKNGKRAGITKTQWRKLAEETRDLAKIVIQPFKEEA